MLNNSFKCRGCGKNYLNYTGLTSQPKSFFDCATRSRKPQAPFVEVWCGVSKLVVLSECQRSSPVVFVSHDWYFHIFLRDHERPAHSDVVRHRWLHAPFTWGRSLEATIPRPNVEGETCWMVVFYSEKGERVVRFVAVDSNDDDQEKCRCWNASSVMW